jgi:hypothetical protein
MTDKEKLENLISEAIKEATASLGEFEKLYQEMKSNTVSDSDDTFFTMLEQAESNYKNASQKVKELLKKYRELNQ